MNTIRAAIIVGLLFTGIATAQINLPQPGLPGSSPDQAVRIVASSEIMVERVVKRWLRTHYPGWDADPIEFQEIGFQQYAVVYITSRDSPGRRVYFRIQSRQNDPTDDGAPFPL